MTQKLALAGLLLLSACISSAAFADSVDLRSGDTFYGDAYVDEQPSGEPCSFTVTRIAQSSKGHHCYDVTLQFTSHKRLKKLPKGPLLLSSDFTNTHSADYPKMKSCAKTLNGNSYGKEIYADDRDADIYTPHFSGQLGGTTSGKPFSIREILKALFEPYESYFLSISPQSRQPWRAIYHRTNAIRGFTFRCDVTARN